MEVKHIIPAYSTAGHGEEREEKDNRFDPILNVVKRFTKKLKRKTSRKKFSNVSSAEYDSGGSTIKEKLSILKSNSVIKWGTVAVISAIILVGGAQYVNSKPAPRNNNNEQPDTRVKAATATQDLNKEFTFPLRNSQGEDVSSIKYTIEKVELRDEIIVKGQKATAIDGRTFLILTLKLQNEHTQAIEIDTKDYVRLSVNGNQEDWLAPDIHNDPVEVQAISTKPTRIGFPINDTDKDLLLRVGEIKGDKQTIELDL